MIRIKKLQEQGLQLLLVKSISPVLILKLQESEIKRWTGEKKILYLDVFALHSVFQRLSKGGSHRELLPMAVSWGIAKKCVLG